MKHIKRKSKASVFVDSKSLVVRLAGSQAQVDKAKVCASLFSVLFILNPSQVLIAEILARPAREAKAEEPAPPAAEKN